jgi:hypothetical protein
MTTIIGVESCAAVWMPIAAFDAPGPRVTSNARPPGEFAVRLCRRRCPCRHDERQRLARRERIEDREVARRGRRMHGWSSRDEAGDDPAAAAG